MRKGIIQIPVSGGSGKVPSGAIQFKDDWPGLFIRGDDCIMFLGRLEWLKDQVGEATFNASGLNKLVEVIEHDVVVKSV